MRYLCLIYWDEHKLATLPDAELNALETAHAAFNEELRRSGHYVAAEALKSSRESTCLRVRGGKPMITDGPFAEAKEVVAGFYLLETADRDEALRIAARIPSATHATVEVRPIHTILSGERN